MECFKLQPRETIVFTIDNNSLLYGRIYQEDGKEINYVNRIINTSSGKVGTWFWNVEWQSYVGELIILFWLNLNILGLSLDQFIIVMNFVLLIEDEKDSGGDDDEMQIPDFLESPKVVSNNGF